MIVFAFQTSRLVRSWLHAGIAVWALPACSAPSPEEPVGVNSSAVRGGEQPQACEWPAVVALDLGCSGALVHPEVVVYAAHCGAGMREVYFGPDADAATRVVAVQRCVTHPRAALGNGFDVAFCLLAEAVDDVPPLRIAAGCELSQLRTGTSATVVGFGVDREGGSFGVKRRANVTIDSTASVTAAQDLVVSADDTGTCVGDSGGPLTIASALASASIEPEERLIALVSAAEHAACGPNTDHYSYLPPLLPWLESTSDRDLTPCFDADGTWHPTVLCTSLTAPLAEATPIGACPPPMSAPVPARTCGSAFPIVHLVDATPPEVEVLMPLEAELVLASKNGVAETALEVKARDAESGVAEVRFQFLDESGVVRVELRDEVPPYRVERVNVPAGAWEMRATARDHARNEREERRTIVVTAPSDTSVGSDTAGCSLPAGAAGRPPSSGGFLLLAALACAACLGRANGCDSRGPARGLVRRKRR